VSTALATAQSPYKRLDGKMMMKTSSLIVYLLTQGVAGLMILPISEKAIHNS
jgi:hypothetical protein